MGVISAATFQRLYLLYLIGAFRNGVYGSKRLHKVAYIPARKPDAIRPFEFMKYLYGQYSDTLDDIKDQLNSMGYIVAVPLDTAEIVKFKKHEFNLGGNRFILQGSAMRGRHRKALAAISLDLPQLIDEAVEEYGYLKEQDLVNACYRFPEFQDASDGNLIFAGNVSDQVEIDLSDDECADLEIALNPVFIETMLRLDKALETQPIEWGKVQKAEGLSAPNA